MLAQYPTEPGPDLQIRSLQHDSPHRNKCTLRWLDWENQINISSLDFCWMPKDIQAARETQHRGSCQTHTINHLQKVSQSIIANLWRGFVQPKMREAPQRKSSGIFLITAPTLVATKCNTKYCESILPRALYVLHCLTSTTCAVFSSWVSNPPFCKGGRGTWCPWFQPFLLFKSQDDARSPIIPWEAATHAEQHPEQAARSTRCSSEPVSPHDPSSIMCRIEQLALKSRAELINKPPMSHAYP